MEISKTREAWWVNSIRTKDENNVQSGFWSPELSEAVDPKETRLKIGLKVSGFRLMLVSA